MTGMTTEALHMPSLVWQGWRQFGFAFIFTMFSSFRQHPSHCSGDACSLFELPESCLMEMALFAADAADRPSYTRIPDVEVDEGPLVAFLLGQAVTQPQECQQMPAHNSFCIRCYLFQVFVECRSGCGKLQVC